MGFLALGVLVTAGALYKVWTLDSLIVYPETREFVRGVTLRWPAWKLTKSWKNSDIECVGLDEHVTVWPGTPKILQFIGKVEPRETSEGQVSIRLQTGKSLDCGKGAWEEASALAARLAGLLGAPKTLRARFRVGPPPSNDISS